MRRIPLPCTVAVLAVAILLAGPLRAAAQEATPDATPAALPATPVGEQLGWLLGVLDGGASSLTPADVTARFAPEVLAVAPAEVVVAQAEELAAAFGPVAFQGFTRPPPPPRPTRS